jgi:hypothetical protein
MVIIAGKSLEVEPFASLHRGFQKIKVTYPYLFWVHVIFDE